MPENRCAVCGHKQQKNRSISLHQLPQKQPKHQQYIQALDITEKDLKDYHCVWSRHFPKGNATKDPQLYLGKQFASQNPKKWWTSKARRTDKRREFFRKVAEIDSPEDKPDGQESPSQSSTVGEHSTPPSPPVMVAEIVE